MNLTPERQIQAAIVRLDMAIEALGRALRVALPVVIVTALVCLLVRMARQRRK